MGYHKDVFIYQRRKPMRAFIIQHVDFEGPGYLLTWLQKNNAQIEIIYIAKPDYSFPTIKDIDLLIILGGPMSVNDEQEYPWLTHEKNFIRQAIHAQVPILGICLGAQLIANSVGGKVYSNNQQEIGWFPVQGIVSPDPTKMVFPEQFITFHWHGERFDIPEDATLLAKSQACPNQAFQLDRRVIGLQFHPEITLENIQNLIKIDSANLKPAPFVQSAETMLSASNEYYKSNHDIIDQVLSYLTQ